MIAVTRLRSGVSFEHKGEPWRVLDYKHVHLSRGGGTITVRARSHRSGKRTTFTFRSGERVAEIDVSRRELTYLYPEKEELVFMDPSTFEQHRVKQVSLGTAAAYLVPGQNVTVVFWLRGDVGELLDVDLPLKVTLAVADASPGVRGDTVAAATKEVVLETGARLRAPLFIKKGDRIVVDTRTGEYVGRG